MSPRNTLEEKKQSLIRSASLAKKITKERKITDFYESERKFRLTMSINFDFSRVDLDDGTLYHFVRDMRDEYLAEELKEIKKAKLGDCPWTWELLGIHDSPAAAYFQTTVPKRLLEAAQRLARRTVHKIFDRLQERFQTEEAKYSVAFAQLSQQESAAPQPKPQPEPEVVDLTDSDDSEEEEEEEQDLPTYHVQMTATAHFNEETFDLPPLSHKRRLEMCQLMADKFVRKYTEWPSMYQVNRDKSGPQIRETWQLDSLKEQGDHEIVMLFSTKLHCRHETFHCRNYARGRMHHCQTETFKEMRFRGGMYLDQSFVELPTCDEQPELTYVAHISLDDQHIDNWQELVDDGIANAIEEALTSDALWHDNDPFQMRQINGYSVRWGAPRSWNEQSLRSTIMLRALTQMPNGAQHLAEALKRALEPILLAEDGCKNPSERTLKAQVTCFLVQDQGKIVV